MSKPLSEQKTACFSIRISEEDRDVMRRVANDLGLSPATLIRYAVKKYVLHCKDLNQQSLLAMGFGQQKKKTKGGS